MGVSNAHVLSTFLQLAFILIQTAAEPTTRAFENLTANLTCLSHTSEWWILPNEQIVGPNQTWDGRIRMDGDGYLRIDDVKPEDNGNYLCVFANDSRLFLDKIHLEVVPTFKGGPVWELYKAHFIQGFIVAGSLLVVIFFSCMVYKFRWKDPKMKGDRQGLSPPPAFEGPVVEERL